MWLQARGTNSLKGSASRSDQTPQGKKIMKGAQNKEQHWPSAETGEAKGRRHKWAGLLAGSEHPLASLYATDLHPQTVSASPLATCSDRWKTTGFRLCQTLHADTQARGRTPCAPGWLFYTSCSNKEGKLSFSINLVARHWVFCLTHQSKCKAIYHHKHNDRLLFNEDSSPQSVCFSHVVDELITTLTKR